MKKFIIDSNGELILGNVDFHFELLPKGHVGCYGGGLWRIDEENKILLLSGKSIDYGVPKFEYLKHITPGYEDYKIMYEEKETTITPKETSHPLSCPEDIYTKEVNRRILEEMKKETTKYDPSKGLLSNFKFNDGYEVKAKNKKDATRKHNAWKRKNKKAKN